MTDPGLIMIVAGEASADAHAAALVRILSDLRPGLRVLGAGGAKLREAGAELLFDFSTVGVVGVTEIIPSLGRFWRAYQDLVAAAAQRRPAGLVLLDLPDFNLMLARKVRKLSPATKIIYYISPQVWAWRRGRIKKIVQRADAMLVIFPFEEELYRQAGMDVEFVGHPLVDSARSSAPAEDLRREFGLTGSPVVALLPGSRRAEVTKLLPVMAEAGLHLLDSHPGAQYVLPRAPTLSPELISDRLGGLTDRVRVISGRACDALAAADAAVVASGTATLEAAVIGTPMVVLGAVSWPSYFLVRPFIRVPHYSLPNVVAGRRLVPELIQMQVRPGLVLAELRNLLDHREKLSAMRSELSRVKAALGEGGASARAARAAARRIWPA